jgi:hypothetical protein
MASSALLSDEENALAGKRKPGSARRKKSPDCDPIEPSEVFLPGTRCNTELERQEVLLYAQRTVWVNLQQIIESAIRQSLNQNYTVAKFLCEFAGVFAASDEETASPAEVVPTSGPEAMRMLLARVAQDRNRER